MTDNSFDVVIVGARCAGSPLAALLARQGVQVALVERATFPRDTLSTHIVVPPKSWRVSYAACGLVLDSLIS